MTWSNWKTEDIGLKVRGAPAVASWKEGRLDVFVVTIDNCLFHRVYENEQWQGTQWADLTDGHTIEQSPSAISWGPNRIDLFAVWDKQLHHRAFINGSWSPWAENLEGATNDAPASASWKFERVDVLVRTTDNFMSRRVWESGKTYEMGKSWKDWENIGGQALTLKSAPTAVATAMNRIDCFSHGATDHLLHAWYNDAKQEAWTEIDSLAIKDAPTVASGVTSDRGRVDVFVRGTDDLLKHRIYYAMLQPGQPASDRTYTVVAGDNMTKIAQKYGMSLQALKNLNPQVRWPFYIIHPGDRILIEHRDAVPGYGGWEPGGSWENISDNKISSSPTAIGWWTSNVLKRIDVFAQGDQNSLIHTWWK